MNLDPIKKRIEAQDAYLTCEHRGGLCHTHNTPPDGMGARNELIQLVAEVERLQGTRIRLINSRKTLEELPDYSLVQDEEGTVWEKFGGRWYANLSSYPRSTPLPPPVRLLHVTKESHRS